MPHGYYSRNNSMNMDEDIWRFDMNNNNTFTVVFYLRIVKVRSYFNPLPLAQKKIFYRFKIFEKAV